MSNNYFQFKRFTVHQDACAMKVCTDACLFGAWTAQKVQALKADSVLDIGTGTGLLSLMVAQKTHASVDAVEIDEAAAKQATANFDASPWTKKLKTINEPIQAYEPVDKYNFVLANPPFFENDLKSNDQQRNVALHSQQLTSGDLIKSIKRLLKEDGYFALLLPYDRSLHYEQLATNAGFHVVEKVRVKQTEKHSFFRSILLFSTAEKPFVEEELIVKINGAYSPEFTQLLKDYYLYL
jgi:tRNA1Val (adenine37-N6)-methyltransferase